MSNPFKVGDKVKLYSIGYFKKHPFFALDDLYEWIEYFPSDWVYKFRDYVDDKNRILTIRRVNKEELYLEGGTRSTSSPLDYRFVRHLEIPIIELEKEKSNGK